MIPRKKLIHAMKGICAHCDQCNLGHISRTSTETSLSVALNREPSAVTKVTNCPKFQQHFALFSGDITI